MTSAEETTCLATPDIFNASSNSFGTQRTIFASCSWVSCALVFLGGGGGTGIVPLNFTVESRSLAILAKSTRYRVWEEGWNLHSISNDFSPHAHCRHCMADISPRVMSGVERVSEVSTIQFYASLSTISSNLIAISISPKLKTYLKDRNNQSKNIRVRVITVA